MTTTAKSPHAAGLKQRWEGFRAANPKVRIRDAASQLGVSEAELVATSCGEGTVRLQGPWPQLLQDLEALGPAMALTRNASAVSEKQGVYRRTEFHGLMGLVLDEGIDLRLFMNHWHHGFAVEVEGHHGPLCSLQFFDIDGTAVHKVYTTDRSDETAYDELVERYASDNQSPGSEVEPVEPAAAPLGDNEVDLAGLEEGWRSLQDTHDFHRLLGRFNVGRVQALKLVPNDLACPVAPEAVHAILEGAVSRQLAIMVFVGSPGVIQIHSGPVRNIKQAGPWLNVLDQGFNLHLRADRIDSAWIVRKPTCDGIVSSLELYDASGETIALLFAKRKEGQSSSTVWTSLLEQVIPAGAVS